MVWVLVREGVVNVSMTLFFFHSGETIIWDFGEFGWKNESKQVGVGRRVVSMLFLLTWRETIIWGFGKSWRKIESGQGRLGGAKKG